MNRGSRLYCNLNASSELDSWFTWQHKPVCKYRELVGSLQLYISFAREPYKRDYILQKNTVPLTPHTRGTANLSANTDSTLDSLFEWHRTPVCKLALQTSRLLYASVLQTSTFAYLPDIKGYLPDIKGYLPDVKGISQTLRDISRTLRDISQTLRDISQTLRQPYVAVSLHRSSVVLPFSPAHFPPPFLQTSRVLHVLVWVREALFFFGPFPPTHFPPPFF